MSLSNQIIRPGLITPGNASYASVVLADKPVAFYLLNETAGTIVHDISGHGNTGTIQGGVTFNQRGTSNGAAAMAFNGSNGYVQLPAATCIQPPLTLEAWVSPASWTLDASADDATFVLATDPGVRLAVSTAGYSRGSVGIARTWYYVDGSVLVPLNQPSLLHVTLEGLTMALYVNGQFAGSETIPSGAVMYDTSTPYVLGADNYSGDYHEFFDGKIGPVAIYPTALTPAQIQAHYNAGRTALRMTGGMTV